MPVKKVLVVDDSATDRAHLQDVLERQNVTVLTASSGQDALKVAASEQPDIIFLDIIMPDMDGYAVCRTLQEDEKNQKHSGDLCFEQEEPGQYHVGERTGRVGLCD